jgi:hypothetical protein
MHSRFWRIVLLSVLAYAPVSAQLEVDQEALRSGESSVLRMTLVDPAGLSVIHISLPEGVQKAAVENIETVTSGESVPLWLTRDSVQFQRRVPQTARVQERADGLWIELAQATPAGTVLRFSLRIAVNNVPSDTAIDLHVRTTDISRTSWRTHRPSRAIIVKGD